MAGFFLATPGDLAGLHENAVRLFIFRKSSRRAEKPALLTSPAFIFNESALCSAASTHAVTTGEAEIGAGNKLDFASLLDDLIVASEKGEEEGARPSIPFDYLSVADELHSGRIKVAGESVAAEYRESGADLAAEFTALLDQAKLALAGEEHRPEETLPPIDPEAIAGELGLDRPAKNDDFGRIRRNFAFANHPDRVAPHLRQRAMIRMQVANMLIDEAKRRALAGARR